MTRTSLPRLMLVTDRHRMRPDLAAALETALQAGARLIQLREKDLPAGELERLVTDIATRCQENGARLVVNSPQTPASIPGLHWTESSLPETCRASLWGVSVHSPEAALRAQAAGAHYVVFGSVFPTASHPGAPAAGLEGLAAVAQTVRIPVFAIGGITPAQVAACSAAGAHGVAVIGAVWDADDVADAVRQLLAALHRFEAKKRLIY